MPADVARSRCRWITNCQNKGIGGDESKGVALTEAQHHPIKRKPLDHIKISTHHYRQDKLWQRSLSEELDLTMFSDLSSFSQTNPGLCVTFDCFACFLLFFQAADTERYTCHIHYDVHGSVLVPRFPFVHSQVCSIFIIKDSMCHWMYKSVLQRAPVSLKFRH